MPSMEADGDPIDYGISGEGGDPLVLVHDAWMDASIFREVVPLLDRSFRVLTYDRRGYGRRTAQAARDGTDGDVADLEALIDGSGFNPTHVAGVGMGGAIALRLAVSRSDLVRSVIAHEPPLLRYVPAEDPGLAQRVGPPGPGSSERYFDSWAYGPGAWGRFAPQWRTTFLANAARGYEEVSTVSGIDIPEDDLRGFDPPALLTYGDRSPVQFQIIAERVQQTLPNATLRAYLGVGHCPPMDDATLFAGSLIAFCLERTVPIS